MKFKSGAKENIIVTVNRGFSVNTQESCGRQFNRLFFLQESAVPRRRFLQNRWG
jgi:hypothetical protein